MIVSEKRILKQKIREILDKHIAYGYRFEMSDYATSKEQEHEIELKGNQQINKAIDKIIELL